jgi:hypothetical protein
VLRNEEFCVRQVAAHATMQPATMQRSVRAATTRTMRACNLQTEARGVRRAQCDVRRPTCTMRRAARGVRRAQCDVHNATCTMRRAAQHCRAAPTRKRFTQRSTPRRRLRGFCRTSLRPPPRTARARPRVRGYVPCPPAQPPASARACCRERSQGAHARAAREHRQRMRTQLHRNHALAEPALARRIAAAVTASDKADRYSVG